MDKITVGIPRSFFYYCYGHLWQSFFKNLKIDVIVSPKTNKKIIELGNKHGTDEMCLAFKNYLGHIAYLKDKCDYIIIPRIDNFGIYNQTCTNFLNAYDIVNNIFNINILNYSICHTRYETEIKGFLKIGSELGFNKEEALYAYKCAKKESNNRKNNEILANYNRLNSSKKKILLISHPYNMYDEFIGMPIINCLKHLDIEIIYSDKFDSQIANKLSSKISPNLYWKYSKEAIGSIFLVNQKYDGLIFLSSFACGLDSLVNGLISRKISKPYLNIIIDDNSSLTELETRLESFVDIIEQT